MKLFTKLSLLITIMLLAAQLRAQQNKDVPITTIPGPTAHQDSAISSKKGVKQVDITDVLRQLFNIKSHPAPDSVTTKPSFSVVPAIGYTLVSKLAIVVSGNVAFRTAPQSRISTVVASTSFTQNKQFTLPVQTNIWSKNNDYNFVGDYRYYKYPQSTFGLGSSSNIKNEDPMDYQFFRFYEKVLRHIVGNMYLGLGFIIDDHWGITDEGNLNGTVSDYSRYGKMSTTVASGFTINGLYDSRDNGLNPSKGALFSLDYRDNYTFLGSTSPWRSLTIDIRKYINFPAGSDNVIALWNYEWLTLSGRPGYLDLPSTQWDASSSTGRGYIQGRFRGAQMVYLEGEYRFKILANGLLGGVVFLNGQSLSAEPGTRLQPMQPGYGPGLRLKLNTISKTNISIDYGFGRQGSNGLFIDVGEMF